MDKNLNLIGLACFVILLAVLIWWLVTKNNKDSITPTVDSEWVALGDDGILYSGNGKKWVLHLVFWAEV